MKPLLFSTTPLELVGLDGNTIDPFQQVVNNSSTAQGRDTNAPVVDAGVTMRTRQRHLRSLQ